MTDIIGITVTALDVQVARLQIPENLGEHTRLKVLAMHPFGAKRPPTLPGNDASPGIRHPGEIHQGNNTFGLPTMLFAARRRQVQTRAMFIGLEELDGLLQRPVLMGSA